MKVTIDLASDEAEAFAEACMMMGVKTAEECCTVAGLLLRSGLVSFRESRQSPAPKPALKEQPTPPRALPFPRMGYSVRSVLEAASRFLTPPQLAHVHEHYEARMRDYRAAKRKPSALAP